MKPREQRLQEEYLRKIVACAEYFNLDSNHCLMIYNYCLKDGRCIADKYSSFKYLNLAVASLIVSSMVDIDVRRISVGDIKSGGIFGYIGAMRRQTIRNTVNDVLNVCGLKDISHIERIRADIIRICNKFERPDVLRSLSLSKFESLPPDYFGGYRIANAAVLIIYSVIKEYRKITGIRIWKYKIAEVAGVSKTNLRRNIEISECSK